MIPAPPDTEQAAPAPETEPEPVSPEEAPAEEIVVYGRLQVDRARDALVRGIEALGYQESSRGPNGVVLRSGDWRGRVLVAEDGTLTFVHPPIGFGAMPAETWTSDPRYQDATNELPRVEAGAGPTFWVLPSASRRAGEEQRVMTATEAARVNLAELRRGTAEQELVDALPDRLDRLWTDGVPLDAPESASVVPAGDRRAAVLTYWARQPDDRFGLRVSTAVEAWLTETWGDALPTADERATYEARRADHRALPTLPAPEPPSPAPGPSPGPGPEPVPAAVPPTP